MKYLHFTIGPVQGFVAQARRTRDFWAGSFILSWLSGIAMKSVEKNDGKVIFPLVASSYLNWLEEIKGTGMKPRQGAAPNRFMAEIPDAGFDPALVEQSVRSAWTELAEKVWQNDLSSMGMTSNQRKIWDEQVNKFWEISWAITDTRSESSILDRRKNWRTSFPPEQGGVKCMVMDAWQELSGSERPGKQVSDFWLKIRTDGQNGMKTDLRDGEHLCAIAFIKRRFARCFHKVSATMPGGWRISGWNVSPNVPSVVYMAAAHWIADTIKAGKPEMIKRFHDAAFMLTREHGETNSNIRCIEDALHGKDDPTRQFAALDGSVFFETMLSSPNMYPDADETTVSATLARLNELIKETSLEPPSPFYAMLLMDGDSLGKHMGDEEKQVPISKALEIFTRDASKIVQKNSGFLIYAGGDDVLAILPVEDALKCAAELQQHYNNCFAGSGVSSTLSGAIEFAHIKMPLTRVLRDAHSLLDDIAKDERGRDAVAVRVWKPGGKAVEWAMPWEKAFASDGKVEIQKIADEFRAQDEDARYSNKFFFKIRELVGVIGQGKLLSYDDMVSLMAAEYLHSGINEGRDPKISRGEAEILTKRLLDQCQQLRRIVTDKPGGRTDVSFDSLPGAMFRADGALLVRFLAQKGVEL
ncbi:MAG: type III-B CRISPR-associated protein Cas10/Cmr2 [Nitrospirae bacterium]|nr:type III-B CRISPR-associated protein Cas10/Cmr2 [Nitrospirota bacterium]